MRHLLWVSSAANVACILAHSTSGLPGRQTSLSLEEEDHKSNRSHQAPQSNVDLTCMRFTGGSCAVFSCKSERGPTVCESGRCMCDRGLCAQADGTCNYQKSKWIGSYSIKFSKPYIEAKPFIGVQQERYNKAGLEATWGQTGTATLASTAGSEPEWKIALSPGYRVRFESLSSPGSVLKLYNNRRRRTNNFLVQKKDTTMEKSSNVTGAAESDTYKQASGIPDNDDLWPIVVPLNEASPLDVTFQVRPTHKDGGGLEIWDPQSQHVLASGNPEWWIKDAVAARGIAECADGCWGGGCEGRQLVQFEPELPLEATPFIPRVSIPYVGIFTFWQSCFIWGCFILCVCGCSAMRISLERDS